MGMRLDGTWLCLPGQWFNSSKPYKYIYIFYFKKNIYIYIYQYAGNCFPTVSWSKRWSFSSQEEPPKKKGKMEPVEKKVYFILTAIYYAQICGGQKTWEFRAASQYWKTRTEGRRFCSVFKRSLSRGTKHHWKSLKHFTNSHPFSMNSTGVCFSKILSPFQIEDIIYIL